MEKNLQVNNFINADLGVESRIYKNESGFSVALFDTDADMRVVLYTRFESLASATIKAKKLANV